MGMLIALGLLALVIAGGYWLYKVMFEVKPTGSNGESDPQDERKDPPRDTFRN